MRIGIFIMKLQNTHDSNSRFARAVKISKNHGGILRTAQALKAGIHSGTLYAMRDSGTLEAISRGVFRLSDNPPLDNPDLVTVATRVPSGVICLISALAFYQLTTQIPHEVHVALPRGAEEPRLDYPPIQTYRFSGEALAAGVDVHDLGGVAMRIRTSRFSRTLAKARSAGLSVTAKASNTCLLYFSIAYFMAFIGAVCYPFWSWRCSNSGDTLFTSLCRILRQRVPPNGISQTRLRVYLKEPERQKMAAF